MIGLETALYALLGGILPSLLWLAFWLKEDYRHPEPRGLILRTFVFGMFSVILVLPFQKFVNASFPGVTALTMLIWVALEEIFKFSAAYLGGLRSVEDNEPVDPVIYMITASLGFAAVENALFIFGSLVGANTVDGVITGNLRFIGASVLHVVSSGIVGVSLALSFYKPMRTHVLMTFAALLIATLFHTGFNLSIVHWGNSGAMLAFGLVWFGAVLLLLAFEKAKTIRKKAIAPQI